MYRGVYEEIVRRSTEADARERSIEYLVEHLGNFLRKRERVLICFLEHEEGNLSWLMEQAVVRCDAVPVVWAGDLRWKTLLRLAFSHKVSAIIGAPLVVLGLTKLKKHSATPLSIRKVVTAGYPCPDWMIDGIVKGLDWERGGCFALGQTGAVAGFACGRSWGVHLREAEYGVDIVDEAGNPLPEGESGEMVLYPKASPTLRYPMGEYARLVLKTCRCGSSAPRLMDMCPGRTEDKDLAQLRQMLHSWTSILDCRLNKGECGLEMEIVVFPGEKLPKLPSAAKLVIRPWNPEVDEPFWYAPNRKYADWDKETC